MVLIHGSCGCFQSILRERLPVPAFSHSPFPIPHSRSSDMDRKGDKALIVGLDIGTSKVVALVGEYSPGNPIAVIGIGSHESRGLKIGRAHVCTSVTHAHLVYRLL